MATKDDEVGQPEKQEEEIELLNKEDKEFYESQSYREYYQFVNKETEIRDRYGKVHKDTLRNLWQHGLFGKVLLDYKMK